MTVRRARRIGRDEQNSAYGPTTAGLTYFPLHSTFPQFCTGAWRTLKNQLHRSSRTGPRFFPLHVILPLAAASGCARGVPSGSTPAEVQPPSPVRLAPDTARYRVASHLTVEQQLGNQPQVNRLALIYLVRVALAPGAYPGELKAEITVDSVIRYEGMGAADRGANQVRGLRFSGTLLPTGELRDLSGADSTHPLFGEIARDIKEFFPRLPPSGLASRISWTDTTEQQITSGGVPLAIHSVAEHLVGEPTQGAEGRFLPINTLTRYTFSGTGRQGGQEFSVEGSGRRHTVEYVSLDGRYRGLVAADTSDFTITVLAAGLSIPGRQLRADTVKVLR